MRERGKDRPRGSGGVERGERAIGREGMRDIKRDEEKERWRERGRER